MSELGKWRGARFVMPLLLALLAPVAPTAEPGRDDETCLGGFGPRDAVSLAREAVATLAQAGHDPAAYLLELRLEDALHPDFPTLGSERVPSVLFVPVRGDHLYPLRVHPIHPCQVGWVWRPEGFTPWQRRVVERATQQARAGFGGSFEPRRVRVVESADLVGLELFGPSNTEPVLSVALSKHDLSPAPRPTPGRGANLGVVGPAKDW